MQLWKNSPGPVSLVVQMIITFRRVLIFFFSSHKVLLMCYFNSLINKIAFHFDHLCSHSCILNACSMNQTDCLASKPGILVIYCCITNSYQGFSSTIKFNITEVFPNMRQCPDNFTCSHLNIDKMSPVCTSITSTHRNFIDLITSYLSNLYIFLLTFGLIKSEREKNVQMNCK